MYETGDGKIVIRTGPRPELGQPDTGDVIATIYLDEPDFSADERRELFAERYAKANDDGERK